MRTLVAAWLLAIAVAGSLLDPAMAVCGNGTVELMEMCDDNNTISGDGCNSTCQVELGYLCQGEPSICTVVCGDGVIVAEEGCDDNNTISGDGCSNTCEIETGYRCISQPSMCDTICGDGLLVGSEQCDDNNTVAGDGCSDFCIREFGFNCTGSPSLCLSQCGDGLVASDEVCDDGNTLAGDGCFSNCEIEPGYNCTDSSPSVCSGVCGDGLLVDSEQCDDNNTMVGDGCSDSCITEFGFICTGSPSLCLSQCGDGLVASDEVCDDGNTIARDGCSSDCGIEPGYNCTNSSPSVCSGICGDGIRVLGEECDDGNSITGDGCSNSCTIDPNFICTEDMYGLSTCTAVLLDLNVPDTTTIDYIDEYFDLNDIFFLFDPNNTNFSSFFVSELGQNWTNIYVVILNGVDPIDNQADSFPQEAFAAGRLPSGLGPRDVPLIRRRLFMEDTRLEGFGLNTSEVVTGMLINRDDSLGSDVFNRIEIEFVLKSLGFIANEHPGYGPREVCIVAQDMMYNTTACVTLYFIGRNDDPPVINYSPNAIVQFVEGQSDFVQIINGSLTVSDPDHPTRYLMMSAQAAVDGFTPNSLEQLSVTYELPGFNYYYDWNTGVLTISGNASTELYSQILSNLTYHNNMTEPLDSVRTIELTVFDGVSISRTAEVTVEIVNVNDPPVISLDGSDPVVTERTVTYREGAGEPLVVPRLVVIDTDPMAMIQRATVRLANPVDDGFEFIGISANLSTTPLTLSSTYHYQELTGIATQEVYTEVLQSLTYLHSDASPGNPTQLPSRMLQFEVEDETNTTSVIDSILTINIQPVNDPPILSIVSDPAQRSGSLVLNGPTEAVFMYLEDDPALTIGRDLYLRDVDSNISTVTVYATGLVDGPQDQLTFPSLYGIYISETELDEGNKTITLSGDFTPALYERVLRSLSYQNTYTNNSVTDGHRTVSIVTTDSEGAVSGSVQIHVDIMDRNDGPEINVGQGVNMDHTITFIENGDSIPITQTFLTSLGDEEGHNISRMTVNLTALNGQLDKNEFIFFRTPGGVDFLNHLNMPLTDRYISISVNSSASIYEQALTSIFYLNDEEEPTIYNSSNGTDRLMRAIIISITDTNYIDPTTDPAVAADADMGISTTTIRIGIEITPVNDNRPRILIRSDPDSCSTDSDNFKESDTMSRRRRGVRSVSRITKKSVSLRSKREQSYSMSPQVVSAVPKFINTTNPSTKCLSQITLTFNANTSAPLVEIPSRIGDLISFDPPELNSADIYGVWLDYRTLVINFMGECTKIEVETTSGKPRPMFVVFEAEQDNCNWDTFCKHGICFQNRTGCPMISYAPITPSSEEPTAESFGTTSPDDPLPSSVVTLLYDVCIASLLILSLIFIIVVCTNVFRNRRRSSPAAIKYVEPIHPLSNKKVEDLIVVTLESKKPTPNVTTTSIPAKPQKCPPSTLKENNKLKDSIDQEHKGNERSDHKLAGNRSGHSVSKKHSPGKKGRKELPQGKRKPPLPETLQETKDPPSSNDRLPVASCDQPHDHQSSEKVGNCTSPQRSREQSVDSSHLHPERTTTSNPPRVSYKSAV